MAIYQRGAGDHVAERVQPEPGSAEEQRLEELVEQGVDGWHRIDDAQPEAAEPAVTQEPQKKPNKASSKAEWVDWAVHQGTDQDEAEGLTLAVLIERYHGAE
ncbi:hypothetical protein PV733_28125 [Streptomyces europaeiscabiei]|uniref:hypothetical protein n=1 Tax=Streptomyces europaeiscabiei TaxID=146819 RepID=UPI0029AD2BB3|nr:hypothetical protein [Streptomyces europaeiscabiei]MDX3712738.1 hypothetical protein [Streptomyces europaeiscabiei]